MFNKQDILKLFDQPEKRLLAAKALDLADLCLKRGIPVFSGFLEPEILETLMLKLKNEKDFSCLAFGGYPQSERQVICFAPVFSDAPKFPVDVIKITNTGQKEIGHRDILGAVLGIGLNRDRIGDIIVDGKEAYVFVLSSVSDFILNNLVFVGKSYVKTERAAEGFNIPEPKFIEEKTSLQSLRLDAFIAHAFNLSREKAKEGISSERVFVNHRVMKNADYKVKEGDKISFKGKGKVLFSEILGDTKKGRILISIHKYI